MCQFGSLRLMLLDRDKELGLLSGLLAGVDTTGGKVVLLRGEAGIGKSLLVRECFGGRDDEAHVYFGFCDDLLTPQPLGPFWDVAREEPSLGEVLEKGDRRAVMEVLLDLLSRSLRPTVLVVEDTHWADEATFDVIKYLGRRIGGTNGLLVLTYRDGEVDHDHPLRQVIGDLAPQDLVRIHLGGLSAEAVASMVEDTGLDSDQVLALTDGNPLFVTEVAASGVEGVPSSVQDSVLVRAGKLSSGARRLLDLVSVIPGESERFLIEIIVEPTEEQMTECVRQGLLRVGDDTVSFHHELTRRAVESALHADDRRRLNQEVLAELGGGADLSRLVHHAREADDVEAIIEFAPRAARAAMAIESHREALAHFRTLEPYLDRITETDRAAILDDWGRNDFYLDNTEALDILGRAIELHRSNRDDHALARSLTFVSRVNEINGRPEAADACVAEAVAILESYPPSGDLAFAVSQRAWLYLMRGDGQRAIELADRAIVLAEETGDERSLIYALNTKGTEMYRFGDNDGFQLLDEARSRAKQAGYPFEESLALVNMASVAAERRELDLASELAQRARDTAARYEIRATEDYARAIYTEVLAWKGAWAVAEELAVDIFGSHREIDSFYGQILGRVIGTLQTRRGRPEAATTLDRTWAAAERSGEMQYLLPAAAAQAEYMWLTGEDDSDRIARFREVLDEGMRLENSWAGGELAFWLWMLDEASVTPEGIAEPYRLVIEGKPAEAATIWEAKGVPYERALALMHADQESRLEALEIFETLGATAVANKLKGILRDDGVAVPRGKSRDTRSHAAGLTARQAEVLQLLDEGLSNLEIADRLFVSPRTVEHHVSAVLTKLDSLTRDEAVAEAHTRGLIAHR
ncbi:MAG: AAA family ATPase [Acidobacteria bacterium]|nr:AAA family ATPase [Acidobacteriota bacterium]